VKIYKFKNKIKNKQIWPRYFVAFSLSEAKQLAEDFQSRMNEANGWKKDLLFNLDFEHISVIETEDRSFAKSGYIEI